MVARMAPNAENHRAAFPSTQAPSVRIEQRRTRISSRIRSSRRGAAAAAPDAGSGESILTAKAAGAESTRGDVSGAERVSQGGGEFMPPKSRQPIAPAPGPGRGFREGTDRGSPKGGARWRADFLDQLRAVSVFALFHAR